MTRQVPRRILILEDESLIAMHLEDLLSEMGHQIIASFNRVAEAAQFSEQADIDFAVLDVNLRETKSFPVAEILRRRGIPFVFATGYGSAGLSAEFCNELTLQKPYEPRELERVIAEACARVGS